MKKKIKRSRSVQVRLTQEEYDFLEQKFKLSGYKSKSEFMRIAFFDTLVVKFSTEDMQELRPNGFTEPTILTDFPIRSAGWNCTSAVGGGLLRTARTSS